MKKPDFLREDVCIIVDANLAHAVLCDDGDPDFIPVQRWLLEPRQDGCIVYGGRLADELHTNERARRFLLSLQRAGRARLIPDAAVQESEGDVVASGLCRSNDEHVIALAKTSGARTLCSHDRNLQTDFKNRHLINNPRGSVYLRPEHARLLRHTNSCGRR